MPDDGRPPRRSPATGRATHNYPPTPLRATPITRGKYKLLRRGRGWFVVFSIARSGLFEGREVLLEPVFNWEKWMPLNLVCF